MKSSRSSTRRVVAALAALGLVAGACSSGGDGTSTGGPAPGASRAPAPIGDPVRGGRLVYAIESDTTNPWTPQQAQCAISCHLVLRTVFDPLASIDEDGNVVPFLASKIEHSDDYRSWTITARPDITFHDDTPLDGAAIAANLQAHSKSALTGTILRDLDSITSDGMTATISFTSPWVWFDSTLTGQLGYIASPTWLAAVADGSGDATKPVGTGPFRFKSYSPGIQATYVGERNPGYWMDGLPYLDEIEFRALPNGAQRLEGVTNGQIDVTHTSGGIDIAEARKADNVTLVENFDYGETTYLLMNVGNEKSALHDVNVRRALALALDRELLTELREADVKPTANGPFNPTQIGYLEDSGFPTFDLEEATRLVDEYEAANGPLTVSIKTTTDPTNAETIELIRSMWADAGIDSSTDEVPQNAFIAAAVTGSFEVFLWRNHGGNNPDQQNHWWHGDVARAATPLKINFGRITDDVIDEQLNRIRGTSDLDEVRDAAETINRRFGEQVYNIWLWWDVWGIVARPRVQNLTDLVLPTGAKVLPFGIGFAGAHQLTQVWVNDDITSAGASSE